MPLYNSWIPYHRVTNQQRRIAEHIEWTPSARCPCTQDQNQADPNHVLCRGSGHIPLQAQSRLVRAVVSRFSARYSQMDAGSALPGDLVISPMSREPVVMGAWDMVRVTGWERGEAYPGDIITAPSGSISQLGTGNYGTGQFSDQRQNFLTYDVKRVEQCFSVTSPDQPASAVIQYTENVDFTVSGHILTWINTPPEGTLISVKYRAIMEYVVVDIPDVRYERGTELGQRILARKREFVEPGVTAGTSGHGTFY